MPAIYSWNYPIVVTGGTGSFGRAFVEYLLAETRHKVRIINRDEHKQAAMRAALPPSDRLTYILADVREPDTLAVALRGAGAVVHAAALKVVGMGEQYPDEFAAVNVTGTRHVIHAALDAGVPRTLLISSDKACQPINAYGATKMLAERLIIQANKMGAGEGLRFAAARGGNVWASNGSVARLWRAAVQAGQPLVVTDPDTTRFHLPMASWVAFAYRALGEMHGGELFVPRAPAWRLGDLAAAFEVAPGGMVQTERRQGDKIHEQLYSADEAERTVRAEWAYIVEPPPELRAVWDYEPWDLAPVGPLAYTSDRAPRLAPADLRRIIQETWDK